MTDGKQICQVIFSNSSSKGKNWSEIADAFGVGFVTELVIEGRDHRWDISRFTLQLLFSYNYSNYLLFFYCQEERTMLSLFSSFSKQVLVQQLNWVMSCLPSPSRREHVSMQWFPRLAYMERELTGELEQAWCSCPTVPGKPKLACTNGMALCRLVCWENKCKPALPEQAKK